MKVLVTSILLVIFAVFSTGCSDGDSKVVSYNLSQKADKFEIDRRIVFYNGITGGYILTIEGKCSIKKDGRDNQLEVTCRTGKEVYKKHYLGISDNVTYFAEQLNDVGANKYHYEVVFKPQSIIPDVDFRGSTKAMGDALTPDNND